MAKQLRGVMAALLTPFNSQQALDKESLRRLVQFNIQQGIDGLYVGGSTGEAFVQSLAEREQVLEIVAEEAKGKVTLIAHVGCVSTADGPGITVTGRSSSAAARTASKPGSETTGIPASVTTSTRCPARTASRSVAVRSASLCSW